MQTVLAVEEAFWERRLLWEKREPEYSIVGKEGGAWGGGGVYERWRKKRRGRKGGQLFKALC